MGDIKGDTRSLDYRSYGLRPKCLLGGIRHLQSANCDPTAEVLT